MRRFMIAATLAAAAFAVACGDDATTSSDPTPAPTPNATQLAERTVLLPRVRVGYGESGILAEVALTPEQIERGLAFRDTLFEQGGMLFDLGETRPAAFWMKGMRIPLDMIWVDENKTVVSVTANVQPPVPGTPDSELERYSPEQPVRYVLEVNAGKAASSNIAPGTVLDFTIPDNIRTPVALPSPTPVAGATDSSPAGVPPSPAASQ